eukprot:COSAG01_NODE_74011_length_230_cov_10.549618_1_plen_27_part_10
MQRPWKEYFRDHGHYVTLRTLMWGERN